MSKREIISMDDLSAWLTQFVEQHEDCEGTTVPSNAVAMRPRLSRHAWLIEAIDLHAKEKSVKIKEWYEA